MYIVIILYNSHAVKRDTNFLKEYHMIKYPQRLFGLPNEKLFKMDTQNMVSI